MLVLTIGGKTEHLSEDSKDDAMLRYWTARSSGDPTAALVRVAGNPSPSNDPDPDDPPPAPTPAGAVSPLARARIAAQDAWLQQAGFALAPPLFAAGTRVLPLGDDNFRLERTRVEALPSFAEACDQICTEIAAEARQDLAVGFRSVHMDENGALDLGEPLLALEADAFTQLAVLGGFGLGNRYLQELCSTALRADNVNEQLSKARNRPVVFRTRLGPSGERQIFATVTPTYAAVDTDVVLAAVRPTLADARAEMLYDGTGVRATALWMPDTVMDLAAGDVFKVGVRLATDDRGRGRIRISGVAFRNRCLNLLILDEGEVETVSLVHRGDRDRILDVVRHGVEKARASVGAFLDAWGRARTLRVDPEETIRRWLDERRLQVRTRQETDAVVATLLSAWQKEPGDTLADVVNAVTRAAHEEPSWGLDVREALERQAAQLVRVPR